MTAAPSPPSRFAHSRFVATTMIGAYLIINALLAVIAPLTAGWPTAGMTAIVVPPMVLAMIHIVIPLARRAGR